MNLVPLFEEALEFQDYNGSVLSNGKVAVYYIGRTRLADIYNDIEGMYPAENPRVLNNLGMGPIYVSDAFDYEMVVFDMYGEEIFSIKKYLHSAGDHTTSNVVVTPSETIAVSAWTIGDVQVYMPYLTGQLGKVYEGVDPVNVDNINDRISVSHIPIGVQTPLFFVEDSETACIIGCSAQSDIPSALSGKWDEASDWVTGNSASVATTGDLNDLAISISETYQPKGDYLTTADSADFYTVDNQSGFITGVDLTPYQTTAGMTAYATTGDVTGKLDTTAFSTVSGDFMTALPAGTMNESSFSYDDGKITAFNGSAFKAGDEFPQSATDAINVVTANSGNWNGVTDKLDTTAFSTVSGDFLTAVPAGYATEDWVTAQGYITAETDWSDTITAASANAYEQATAAIPAPFDPSYLSGQINTKLDSAIYAADSGNFLTAHQSLPNSANWDSTYNTVATNSAAWGAGITVATGSI